MVQSIAERYASVSTRNRRSMRSRVLAERLHRRIEVRSTVCMRKSRTHGYE